METQILTTKSSVANEKNANFFLQKSVLFPKIFNLGPWNIEQKENPTQNVK